VKDIGLIFRVFLCLTILCLFQNSCGTIPNKSSSSKAPKHSRALDDNVPDLDSSKTKRSDMSDALKRLLKDVPNGQTVAFVGLTESNDKKTKLSNELFYRIEPKLIDLGKQYGVKFIERHDLKLILDEWKLNMTGIVRTDPAMKWWTLG